MENNQYSDYHSKDRKIIWVDKEVKEKLKAMAEEKGRTMKEIISDLVLKAR